MPAPSQNANGHRRRELVKRVKAEERNCALCDQPVDPSLTMTSDAHGPRCVSTACTGCIPHPMRGEVDEDVPRARGGSPYLRSNTHLMHRVHNQWKSTMTLAEARTKWHALQAGKEDEAPKVQASPIW